MANEVTTNITINSDNPEITKKLKELFSKKITDVQKFYKTLYPDNTDMETYSNDMGTKWCYLEDSDIYQPESQLTLTSAWSFPDQAFKQIYHILANIDPNIIIYCTYRDEVPLFIGAAAYGPNGYNVIEEPDVEEYPDEDNYETTKEWEEAIEDWDMTIHTQITDLKEICLEKSM